MSEKILTPGLLRDWPLPAVEGEGKRARGDVLVVGGSRRTPGAVILAGLAALRAGAGRLTLAAPAGTSVHIGVAVPESGVLDLAETDRGSVSRGAAGAVLEAAKDADAVLIGPGLDDPDETTALLAAVLSELDGTPTVLDAYALGCLPRVDAPAASGLILTPNRTEAAFLSGSDVTEPAAAARCIAQEYGAVVCLEGHIADSEGGHWVTDAGHVGLGTSGSGDVLAGLICGLLARGAGPAQAACWGTHLHVTAGLRIVAESGPIGFLARDLVAEVPRVLAELQIR
jgi:hydroxyethylthiazole kinase-like uncharacterized protein yjeF